jgi:hypothetical protein
LSLRTLKILGENEGCGSLTPTFRTSRAEYL